MSRASVKVIEVGHKFLHQLAEHRETRESFSVVWCSTDGPSSHWPEWLNSDWTSLKHTELSLHKLNFGNSL